MNRSISPKLLSSLTVVLVSAIFAFGQAGALDTSFNASGTQVIPTYGNGGTIHKDTVVQSDGKVVSLINENVTEVMLVRLNLDGTLDETFDSDGLVTTNWHYSPTLPSGYPFGLAIQKINGEERLVVAGSWTVPSGKRSSVLMLRVDRYLSNGQPDPSFGTNGTVLVNKPYALAVAIQPDDNKIVTVGDLQAVVRLNENGTIDTSFGPNSDGATGAGQSGWAINVLPGGRILIGGSYANKSGTTMCVSALNENGSVAEDFGTQGRALADFYGRGSFGRAFDIAIDPFGNILAGGIARPKGASLAENVYAGARFTSSGQPDTSFSGDGKVTFSFFGLDHSGRTVASQSDGKVILGGSASLTSNSRDFALVRFNFDGTVDETFGTEGKVTTDMGGTSEYSAKLVVWRDPECATCPEKIYLAGGTNVGAAFARYLTQ